MIKTFDGNSYKRVPGLPGDRTPTTGFQRQRAVYIATGGETTINLAALPVAINYIPGANQLSVYRGSGGGKLLVGDSYFESNATLISFPINDPLLPNESVEIIKEFQVTGVMAASLRNDYYTTIGSLGQTAITANFNWSYNLNPTAGNGGVEVVVNGVIQTRGYDYTEVYQGTANTNQIILNDPLVGGEIINLKPMYQVIDQSAASTTYNGIQLANIQSSIGAGFQGFVDTTSMIPVPGSTIQNRAMIPNLANDLKCTMGIERIMAQQIYQIQNESGPNGESVYGVVNDTFNQIRIVGAPLAVPGTVNSFGSYISNDNGYVEITFFGTGLNLIVSDNDGLRDFRVAIDGGSASGNLAPILSVASVLEGRNYFAGMIYPVVANLTRGVHTAKIIGNPWLRFGGFEVINEASSVNVNPGISYLQGKQYQSISSNSFAYNSLVTGVRGGRVITYQNPDGSIGQAFRAVNASQGNLISADHTNEEVVRVYNWREFGAGRSDDFSTLASSASSRAFTLDDGTTSLVASSSQAGVFGPGINIYQYSGNGQFSVFTFIGTGVDLMRVDDTNGGSDTYSVAIDGVSIGNLSSTGSNILRREKLVSGLPYGTHTVKITRTSAVTFNVGVLQYIVYQPKKPSLPSGTVELADYNVLANYAANTTAGPTFLSTGILRKASAREFVYTGTWNSLAIDSSSTTGFLALASTSGATASYTFFGTGVDIRFYCANAALNYTVQVDRTNPTAAGVMASSLLQSGSGLNFVASTGVLSGTSSVTGYGNSICLSGLPLAKHTVTFTYNSGATMNFDAFDVITPIHSVKSNIYSDSQNTLSVGSNSISDNRKFTPIKEIISLNKAWAQAIGVQSSPSTASTAFVPVPDMSTTINTQQGALDISATVDVANGTSSASNAAFQIFVDGMPVGIQSYQGTYVSSSSAGNQMMSIKAMVPVSKGTHKIDLYWCTPSGAGAASCNGTNRILQVKEI